MPRGAAGRAAHRCWCQPATKIVSTLIFHENYLLTEIEKDALMLGVSFLNGQCDLCRTAETSIGAGNGQCVAAGRCGSCIHCQSGGA